ncbi:MAG: penicillin acylase family protein [Chitinophagales bacterium]|nr:penicillin acylase family protein [Chitinophagales bacterium]
MRVLRSILLFVITLLLIFLLNRKTGDIPPLGKLLSPFSGFWQNNEDHNIDSEQLNIPGLKAKVIVRLDDNLVPHIFANNNHDLYFIQGYIHAKYRLWQMEFQTYAAAGRISEIIGEKAVDYDRQQRRFGMVYGAENTLKAMLADSLSAEAVNAYTEGVNVWIEALAEKDFPIEYKLLDYKPEPWTPLKCALLLKYMTYDLAGFSNDFFLTNILKTYGQPAIDSLFPSTPLNNNPIIPSGTSWGFLPLPLPVAPKNSIVNVPDIPYNHPPNPDNGSNNWAVSGRKTASGSAILCGDPHLGLNLPSLWFQIQLVSPDCNVTGVSLPGTPSVIIGFNEHIAWSETNVDADVLDWYSIKFKDSSRNEYYHDNQWKTTIKKIDTIKIRGGSAEIDTIIFTEQGPIVGTMDRKPLREFIPTGYAMKWLGHEPTQELRAFLELNRAKNYSEFVNALKYFQCPAQNFVYADVDNNIAIWVNGKFPLKWKNQGKFLLDGTDPANEWQGWIPHNQNPHVINPARGFVSSANQSPADSTYPYYLNWEFETFTRGYRINERLEEMNSINRDSMRLLQGDVKNIIAENVLPVLMENLNISTRPSEEQQIIEALRSWNFLAVSESIEQTFFDLWWREIQALIWDDEFGSKNMRYPDTEVSMNTVMKNVNRKWIDNTTTDEIESLQDIINQSFYLTMDSLNKSYGSDWKQWKWYQTKATRINHLLRIPTFSHSDVKTGGGRLMVNATASDHGPSWRMIVELNDEPLGYGIYPGGQSGNPGSYYYDNMLDSWAMGLQKELVVLHSPSEPNNHIVASITFNQ